MIILDVCLSDIPANARRTGKNNKVYTNFVVDTLKQPDNYGNTHTVYMSQSKEEKLAKTPRVYVGKAKEFIFNNNNQQGSGGGYVPSGEPENSLPF